MDHLGYSDDRSPKRLAPTNVIFKAKNCRFCRKTSQYLHQWGVDLR